MGWFLYYRDLRHEKVKEVVLAVSSRVCVDGRFFWTDSEGALCWVNGKELCWKPWVENRVVAIRKTVDRNRLGHTRGAVNPVDIPTRVCDVNDFNRQFWDPAFLFQIKFNFEGLDAAERLESVEDVLSIEAKGKGNSKEKVKSSLNSCVVTRVVITTPIEHVNKQTLSKKQF